MYFRLSILVIVFSLWACYADHPPSKEVALASSLPVIAAKPAPKPAISPDSLAMLQHFIDQAFDQSGTPGATVVIVKDSQIVLIEGYGTKNSHQKEKPDAHTVYRLGSLSKGISAVLAGVLVQEQALGFDDKVQQFLPYFQLKDKRQAQRMTISHVLSQSTGLSYHAYTNLIEEGVSIQEIIKHYLPRARLSYKEGSSYSYQNAAYCCIQPICEAATKQPFATLLHQKLFEPCNMTDASCTYLDMQQSTNKALPHQATASGWQAQDISQKYYDATAAGGINASGADMAQYLKLLIGNNPNVLGKTTLNSIFEPRIKTDNERHIAPHWVARRDAYYAYGWRILQDGARTYAYHGGYVNGYKSEIALNREKGIGVCVLTNGSTNFGIALLPKIFDFLN